MPPRKKPEVDQESSDAVQEGSPVVVEAAPENVSVPEGVHDGGPGGGDGERGGDSSPVPGLNTVLTINLKLIEAPWVLEVRDDEGGVYYETRLSREYPQSFRLGESDLLESGKVNELERLLRARETGIQDDRLEEIVSLHQKEQGENPTGFVTNSTWASLLPMLRPGDSGPYVGALQRALALDTHVTNRFDDETAMYVISARKLLGLTEAPVVDYEMWRHLFLVYQVDDQ